VSAYPSRRWKLPSGNTGKKGRTEGTKDTEVSISGAPGNAEKRHSGGLGRG
jgi:hypothetical protein